MNHYDENYLENVIVPGQILVNFGSCHQLQVQIILSEGHSYSLILPDILPGERVAL